MSLLGGPVRVVSAGAAMLADALEVENVRVDWRPPLEPLTPHAEVDDANREAVARMLAARPRWVGVGVARDFVPGMRDDLLLHSGPPLRWEAASGPMRGALEGALRLEGRSSGDLEPCHEHMAVGPMAGVISAGMPVVVVEDQVSGTRAYSNLNEGLGRDQIGVIAWPVRKVSRGWESCLSGERFTFLDDCGQPDGNRHQ